MCTAGSWRRRYVGCRNDLWSLINDIICILTPYKQVLWHSCADVRACTPTVQLDFAHTLESLLLHCNTMQQHSTYCISLTAPYCASLHNTAPHWTHDTALHSTAPRCITLHCTATHCNTLHHIAPHCTATHCTTLHRTAPHCNTLHHIVPHCNTLHHIAPHWTTLHYTALHCITLHHTAPRCTICVYIYRHT